MLFPACSVKHGYITYRIKATSMLWVIWSWANFNRGQSLIITSIPALPILVMAPLTYSHSKLHTLVSTIPSLDACHFCDLIFILCPSNNGGWSGHTLCYSLEGWAKVCTRPWIGGSEVRCNMGGRLWGSAFAVLLVPSTDLYSFRSLLSSRLNCSLTPEAWTNK
jgi:hypothetical protein